MTRFADLNVTAGPGDPDTWGPPTGHPNDPRTDSPDLEAGECVECGSEDVVAGEDYCPRHVLEDPRIDAAEWERRR